MWHGFNVTISFSSVSYHFLNEKGKIVTLVIFKKEMKMYFLVRNDQRYDLACFIRKPIWNKPKRNRNVGNLLRSDIVCENAHGTYKLNLNVGSPSLFDCGTGRRRGGRPRRTKHSPTKQICMTCGKHVATTVYKLSDDVACWKRLRAAPSDIISEAPARLRQSWLRVAGSDVCCSSVVDVSTCLRGLNINFSVAWPHARVLQYSSHFWHVLFNCWWCVVMPAWITHKFQRGVFASTRAGTLSKFINTAALGGIKKSQSAIRLNKICRSVETCRP